MPARLPYGVDAIGNLLAAQLLLNLRLGFAELGRVVGQQRDGREEHKSEQEDSMNTAATAGIGHGYLRTSVERAQNGGKLPSLIMVGECVDEKRNRQVMPFCARVIATDGGRNVPMVLMVCPALSLEAQGPGNSGACGRGGGDSQWQSAFAVSSPM